MPYWLRILLALDQLANVLLGGDEDMSISARAHVRYVNKGGDWRRDAINKLFFWQKDHCRAAFVDEYAKRQAFIKQHRKIFYTIPRG